jgi:hypothetical protein
VNDWVLLIDAGASFSRAMILDADGRTEPVEVDGGFAMPSGVWADAAGKLRAGLAAQRQGRLSPEGWDRAPKRSLGEAKLSLGATEVAVPTAIAQVLRELSALAIARRGGLPREVRLLAPARWDAGRRAALLLAAARAGLSTPTIRDGVQLVDGTYAASQYLNDHGKLTARARIALLDLGGGGAETAVIEAGAGAGGGGGSSAGGFTVRAFGGLTGLGGELFDELIFRMMVAKLHAGWDVVLAGYLIEPPNAQWRRAAEGLFREVRRAKEELSRSQTRLDGIRLETDRLIDFPLTLTRIDLEALLRPEILRSARELAATIELSGLRPQILDAVYLTGGASQMPLVTRVVFDVLGVHPQVLPEPTFLAGAAAWTPKDQLDPATTRVTPSGRKVVPEEPSRPLADTGAIPTITPEIIAASKAAREAAAASSPAARAAAAASGLSDPGPGPRPVPGGPAAGGLPYPERPERPVQPLWRRRWPIFVGAAVVLLVGGFVLIGPASGHDNKGLPRLLGSDPESPSSSPGPAPSSTSDPSLTGSALVSETLPTVTGLAAKAKQITVELSWKPVPGAVSYLLERDIGRPEASTRAVTGLTIGDRPGDDLVHEYAVVAVDQLGLPGPVGKTVTARADAPYDYQQVIASAWTAMIPTKPGAKGPAGQTCEGLGGSHYSDRRISCKFKNGVKFEIQHYGAETDRDHRLNELALVKDVKRSNWNAAGSSTKHYTGWLLQLPDPGKGKAPWRWWTFDSAPTFSMSAEWPGHTAKDLTHWWKVKAPFRA